MGPTSVLSLENSGSTLGVVPSSSTKEIARIERLQRHRVTLSKEQCPKTSQEVEEMRHIPYASAVGSLMYAMLCTRPDICYAMRIVRYTYSDFQTDRDSKKSTSSSVFTLNGGAVVWRSIKPLFRLHHGAGEAVANSRNPISHRREKHIERKFHLVREIVLRADVIITQIILTHNVVDSFTRPLMAKVFDDHLKSLGLRDMSHLI
ncbi:gag/pol protein [Cucumis melo var. makuwa]|uniref:Gag/pol protein n=1 Tax=Cucumis melo var. makuwa TaxID=1194695 RepID=A0A5D3BDE5_CUCMM|nr:gag/pol protein [Cucumis melo var. makuwa]